MTTPATPAEVAQLRALEADIAPAPWSTRWDGTLGRCEVFNAPKTGVADRVHISVQRASYGNVAPEGEFIVAARNLFPRLLARLDAMEGVVEAAENWAAKCPSGWNSWVCDEPCKAFDLCAALAALTAPEGGR